MFQNALVATHKIKTTLTLNKPGYVGMCILELSKVPKDKFHYDYIKNKYGNKSRLLLTNTGSLINTSKNVYNDFSKNKERIGFSNYSLESKYYTGSKALVVGKMEDDLDGVAIEVFVRLKPKMYSILVSNSSEYKKAKYVHKMFLLTECQNEYTDVSLNKKYVLYSMNRTESKNHKIGTYGINKISLSCFDGKICILDNRINVLTLYY